ncbi:MAG: hypothetical protein NZT92_05930 [Abditibacteriales bacterium]|nr:hypothetical protein [Abditibacteriales bacterium]MDW8365707.1 hypothetical protein [Abditibacteriales bacterium]
MKVAASVLRRSADNSNPAKDIFERLHRGEKVDVPHGANAVRVHYESGAVMTVLTADIDCLAGAGVPVRVEFGRVPYDRKGRPHREGFEVLRKRSAVFRRKVE